MPRPSRPARIAVCSCRWPVEVWLTLACQLILGCGLALSAASCADPVDNGFLAPRRSYPAEPPSGDALRLEANELPVGKTRLKLGISPFESAERTRTDLAPLAKMVGAMLGVPLEITPADSYQALVQAVSSGEVDIALLSPVSYAHARRLQPKLQLVAQVISQGVIEYASFIVVRSDDPAQDLADLHGRRMAWVDPLSASGFIYPLAAFHRAGQVPEKTLKSQKFYGTHEAALQAVLSGEADACAVASGTFERLVSTKGSDQQRASLRVLHKSGKIPFDALVVSSHLSAESARRIGWAFRNVSSRTPAGRAVLAPTWGLRGWVPADDAAYNGARALMEEAAALQGAALPAAATSVGQPAAILRAPESAKPEPDAAKRSFHRVQ